jgi:protocatechuate 3,4-dioxygenase beta subunit
VLAPIEPGPLRLEGQVVDDDDHPIGGAQITLGGARIAVSEVDGSFAFDDLADGAYALIAEKAELYGEELDVQLDDTSEPVIVRMVAGPTIAIHVVDPAGAAIAGAKVETSSRAAITGDDGTARLRAVDVDYEYVSVAAAGHERVRDRVATGDDPAATIEYTVVLGAGAEVAGRVIDEDGTPLASADVEIEAANGRRDETITTDDSGAWQVPDLGAGSYVVRASSSVHVTTPNLALALDGVHAQRDVVLRLARGGQIAGRVVDGAGAPIAGARVTAGPRSETTDASGAFVARGLVADTYDVVAETDTAGMPSQSVKLAAGGKVEVTLVLRPSSIAGIVVNTRGEPVDDARVFARSADPHGVGYARTDDRGRFDLGGLPPGDYELETRRAGARHDVEPPIHVRSGTRNVRIVVPDLSAIVGRVMLDGKPVPYFGIAITDDPSTLAYERPRAVRDASGGFAERGIAPGSWAIVIVGPDFERRVLEHVRVAEGETTDLGDIVVERGPGVHGRVVDPRGVPIAGATVRIADRWAPHPDGRLRALMSDHYTATTDARGQFRIDGVSPTAEPRRIVASHPTLGTSAARTLAAGEVEVELVIVATGGIDGTIANVTPGAAMRLAIAQQVTDHDVSYDAQIDARGGFRFDQVLPGEYEISLPDRRNTPPISVTVVANARVPVAFELPRVPVRLVVRGPADCSLVGLRTHGSDATFAIETCDHGQATFADLAAGRYDACLELTACTPIDVPARPEVTITLAP